MYIERDRVRDWLTRHPHRVLGLQDSIAFESYLNTLPWAGSHVDWSKVNNEKLTLPESVDDAFTAISRSKPWGRHGHLFIMYNGDQPAILCQLEDAIADLDLLYSVAPGTRFFCGAEVDSSGTRVVYSDFAEYDGGSRIQFPVG